MEPTTRVELVTCRSRNSSAPRKLLKDLGCISTLWGIENRCGRKMCNTLCNGRLDYIARQRVRNFGLQVFGEGAVKRLLLFAIIIWNSTSCADGGAGSHSDFYGWRRHQRLEH